MHFFNPQDVWLKCWSNPTLHDETSRAPKESVFMGCCVEGVLQLSWPLQRWGWALDSTDDKEDIKFLSRLGQKWGRWLLQWFLGFTVWVGRHILCWLTGNWSASIFFNGTGFVEPGCTDLIFGYFYSVPVSLSTAVKSLAFCLFLSCFAGSKINSLPSEWGLQPCRTIIVLFLA